MAESSVLPRGNQDAQRRAVLIAGPTASGKSALALALARELDGVVVNADAMQVYADLAILTARPDHQAMRAIPHRLYGHVDALDSYSVARWLQDATAAITETWQQRRTPIIVGGTGLYFRALEHGLAVIPPVPPTIRDRWRRMLAKQGSDPLYVELDRRDPRAAAAIRPTDAQRVLRALEVHEATGRSLLDWQAETTHQPLLECANTYRLALSPSRPPLHARINERFLAMVSSGALDEVMALIARNPPADAMILKAIGVTELASVIEGRRTMDEAVSLAQARTRQYAKRQMTWFRNQMASWTTMDPDDQEAVASVLAPLR